jgi:hypothetical protein
MDGEMPSVISGTTSGALNARARFFPAWWMHVGTPPESKPLYRVVCVSSDEVELAQALAPDCVRAQYLRA